MTRTSRPPQPTTVALAFGLAAKTKKKEGFKPPDDDIPPPPPPPPVEGTEPTE